MTAAVPVVIALSAPFTGSFAGLPAGVAAANQLPIICTRKAGLPGHIGDCGVWDRRGKPGATRRAKSSDCCRTNRRDAAAAAQASDSPRRSIARTSDCPDAAAAPAVGPQAPIGAGAAAAGADRNPAHFPGSQPGRSACLPAHAARLAPIRPAAGR